MTLVNPAVSLALPTLVVESARTTILEETVDFVYAYHKKANT